MTETLGSPEFEEQLPKAAEFDRSRKMAVSAAELAEATKEQLETEVAAKNAELEENGLIGSQVEFGTAEEFSYTEEKGLEYNFYGVRGYKSHQIAGRFNGLIVVDSTGAIVNNKMGFKVQGIEPDRYIVCAAFDVPEEPETRKYIPLRGIETALLPPEKWDDIALAALGEADR